MSEWITAHPKTTLLRSALSFILGCGAVLAAFPGAAGAQTGSVLELLEAEREKKSPEKLKETVLASLGGDQQKVSVSVQEGEQNTEVPIGGGIAFGVEPEQCMATFSNRNEHYGYDISWKAVTKDPEGAVLFDEKGSMTLNAGSSTMSKFKCRHDARIELVLLEGTRGAKKEEVEQDIGEDYE